MQIGQKLVFTNRHLYKSMLTGNLVLGETYSVIEIYKADEYLDEFYKVIDSEGNTHCGFWHEFELV